MPRKRFDSEGTYIPFSFFRATIHLAETRADNDDVDDDEEWRDLKDLMTFYLVRYGVLFYDAKPLYMRAEIINDAKALLYVVHESRPAKTFTFSVSPTGVTSVEVVTSLA